MVLLLQLLIAHLAGDFFLQSNKLVNQRTTEMAVRIFIYPYRYSFCIDAITDS